MNLGWVPVVFPSYDANVCRYSGWMLQDWTTTDSHTPARTIQENIDLFCGMAGPRPRHPLSEAFPLVHRNPSTRYYPSQKCERQQLTLQAEWRGTKYGAASVTAARRLLDSLSGGSFSAQTAIQEDAWAYAGNNIIFFDNVKHDLNPGYSEKNVWLSGFLLNVAALPDELLLPLATYIVLRSTQTKITGSSVTPEQETKIQEAAFGPLEPPDSDPLYSGGWSGWRRAFRKSNLLWVLWNQDRQGEEGLGGFTQASIAILSEVGARAKSKMKAAEASGGSTVPLVVGGLGIAALLAWALWK
jgi:hypothetical protein